jgi:UDPglucose 6-dehydrogenase
VPALQQAGATIRAYDPEGMGEAKKLMPELVYCDDACATMDGADALVIITEWNEFRLLDLERAKRLLKSPVVVDLPTSTSPPRWRRPGSSTTASAARRGARRSKAVEWRATVRSH